MSKPIALLEKIRSVEITRITMTPTSLNLMFNTMEEFDIGVAREVLLIKLACNLLPK